MKPRHIRYLAGLFVSLASPLSGAEVNGRIVSVAGQIDSEVRPALIVTTSRARSSSPTVDEGESDFPLGGRRPNVSEGTPDTSSEGRGIGFIEEIAVSPDGKRLLSVSVRYEDAIREDVTAILWDTTSGRPISTIHTNCRRAGHFTFADDGGHALFIDADENVRNLDLNTGEVETLGELKLRRNETAWFESVLFSADETRAIAAVRSYKFRGEDGTVYHDSIRVFAIRTGEELCSPQGIEGRISGLTLSQDGKRVFAAENNTWLCVWDAETGRAISRVQTPAFTKIAFSKSRPIAVMDSVAAPGFLEVGPTSSAVIRVVDVSTGRDLRTFERERGRECDVAISANGKTIAAGDNKSVRVWDVDMSTVKKDVHVGGWRGKHLTFSQDGRTLAATKNGTRIRWLTVSGSRAGIQERQP
jgi:WD40 repeat protein